MRIFVEHERPVQRLILWRQIAMRQIVPVVLLSALIALPSAFAQRGAGRSGGFSGGHFGGSFGHSFSGGHSFGGSFGPGRMAGFPMRSFGTAPRMNFTAPGRAFAPESAWRSGGGRDRGGRYRSPYRGYGYGYGGYPYVYANSWELLPWDLGYSDFTGEDDDDTSGDTAQQQPAPESVPPPDNGYRPQYSEPYGDYAPPPEGYYPPRPAATLAPEPQLTLIFKDGRQESIQNYALTPTSVIVMDQPASGRQQRIPLADVNLPATEQAAQQAGLDFTPPG